jgi:hypothetical protein
MVLPHSTSIKSKYRSRLVYYSLALTISLPLLQIQASPTEYCAGKEVKSYNWLVNPEQVDKHIRLLEQGKPVERELTGGQSHSYQITLAADQYVKLVITQRDIDVVVNLLGPDGKLIAQFNSERRMQGEEPVSWVAEEAGGYRLGVSAKYKNAAAGRYQIQVVEVGISTEGDRALHEALRTRSPRCRSSAQQSRQPPRH